jgi:hypothetical protein
MSRASQASALGAAVLALVTACESIPPIAFYRDDGGADSTAPPLEGGSSLDGSTSDGSADGAGGPILDGSPDQIAPDAGDSSAATCPATPPAGASLCCDQIPCNGDAKKCASACANCESTCNVGQTCCLAKNGSIAACTAAACP